jgi:diaminopimelate epimerase
VPDVEWFMDYRNADGTAAEMCGNGVRVYARYLAHLGWLGDGRVPIGTRAGVRQVVLHGPEDGFQVSVDMGPAAVGETSTASVDGEAFPGTAVDVGNPHLACVTEAPIDGLDLTRPPGHDPSLFPHGVNVEFVSPIDDGADGEDGEVCMRVHERGVGETRSCGTGACAAAYAALVAAGRAEGSVVVDVPGGRLTVQVDPRTTLLTGPAVIVSAGVVCAEWLDA